MSPFLTKQCRVNASLPSQFAQSKFDVRKLLSELVVELFLQILRTNVVDDRRHVGCKRQECSVLTGDQLRIVQHIGTIVHLLEYTTVILSYRCLYDVF